MALNNAIVASDIKHEFVRGAICLNTSVIIDGQLWHAQTRKNLSDEGMIANNMATIARHLEKLNLGV